MKFTLDDIKLLILAGIIMIGNFLISESKQQEVPTGAAMEVIQEDREKLKEEAHDANNKANRAEINRINEERNYEKIISTVTEDTTAIRMAVRSNDVRAIDSIVASLRQHQD